MKLFFREYGQGQPMIILHGLFGSCDNWLTQAKMLSPHYKIYTVDLRNHGQSPHSDDFDYPAMVSDLKEFVDEHGLTRSIVIGHSMGGKVAMNFALSHAEIITALVVVDIAPRAYNLEHYTILEGLNAIPLATLTSRQEADDALAAYVPEPEVRQFLLKNLQRKQDGGFSWKLNLPVITEKLSNIGVALTSTGTFEGRTLFVRGSRSNYIGDADMEGIKEIFLHAEAESLDTGHWVQAEKPQEFVDLVSGWLGKS